MPVLRKFGAHKAAVRNIKISERNGNLTAHGTANASLLSHLTINPVYHKPVAILPTMTPMQFELLLFCYLMIALFMQYLNIYKTNTFVIDLHLVLFISITLARRLSWLAVRMTLASEVLHTPRYWAKIIGKASIAVSMGGLGIWAFYSVIQNSSFEDVLFLCYPFAVYIWTFGFTLNPYGHKVLVKLGSHQSEVMQDLITSNTSMFLKSASQKSFSHMSIDHSIKQSEAGKGNTGPPNILHNGQTGGVSGNGEVPQQNGEVNKHASKCHEDHCTLSPDSVRYEAECLRTDFNLRIKQVIFNSVVSAYYVGFIPVKFIQSGWLYYDLYWSVQFVLFIWLNCFVVFMSHLMPFVYIDGLHRCAMHLGSWKRYHGVKDTQHVWSPLTIWPQGVLVKHSKVIYKSVGKQNTAVPGDSPQSRLYFMFSSPLRLLNWLVLLQLSVSCYQLYILLWATLWHQVVSLFVMLGFSYAILFRLLRERWAVQATLEEHEACAGT
eukprot:gene139-751_t